MLVIHRKTGENIILAEHITVSVLSIEGSRVKLGFTAPLDVRIVRAELLHRDAEDTSPSPLPASSLEVTLHP